MFLLYISIISLQGFPSEELISPFIHKINASLIFKLKKHLNNYISKSPVKNDKRSNLSKAVNDSPSSEGQLKNLLRMKQPHWIKL